MNGGFNNSLFNGTIHSIFQKNNKLLDNSAAKKKFKGIHTKDLELALTVLLVDLASCDQNFDQREYQLISQGLRRLFGTSKTEVSALVNEANTALANLRGSTKFAGLLREHLPEAERRIIMEVIDDVIMADGQEDGFETYLRHKFADLLGIALEPNA